MKTEFGLGPPIFSSAPAGVAPVLGPLCRPKRPGKKPFLVWMLSIFSAGCICFSCSMPSSTTDSGRVHYFRQARNHSSTRLKVPVIALRFKVYRRTRQKVHGGGGGGTKEIIQTDRRQENQTQLGSRSDKDHLIATASKRVKVAIQPAERPGVSRPNRA